MPRSDVDRALRRAVYPLAEASPDDVEFVLAALTDSERAQVKHALSGLTKAGAGQAVQPELTGLSDWLALRARPDRFGASGHDNLLARGTGMTPHATSVLQDSVRRLADSADRATKLPVAPPSLIDRVAGFVWRKRGSA